MKFGLTPPNQAFCGRELVIRTIAARQIERALVTAAPLPANVKTDLTQTLNGPEADLNGLASLADTELGNIIADGVDDATTVH